MSVVRAGLMAIAVVVLLVCGAAIALFTLDLGSLSQPLVRWASDRLQRPLFIDGAVSIRAGRTLHMSAAGVRLGNVSWGSRGDMLTVSRLTVEIDTVSLIRRPVIVRRMEFEGLDLLLERRDDGASNWVFAQDSAPRDSSWRRSLPVVDAVSLKDVRVRFTGPRLDRPLDLRFDSLEQHQLAEGMLGLVGRGAANDEPIVLEARAGPFESLVAGRDFGLALNGRLGELDLDLDLRVDDIMRPVDTVLGLTIRGPGADYLTGRFGVRNLGTGPLVLEASIRPSADGAGVEGELTGQVGQFTVEARAALTDPAVMATFRAELDVAGPDLSLLGGLVGLDRLPVEPFHLIAAVDRADESLRINDARLTVPAGQLNVSGRLGARPDYHGTRLAFVATGPSLARAGKLAGIGSLPRVDFAASGEFGWGAGGATLRQGQLRAGPDHLALDGVIARQPLARGTDLAWRLSGPDLAGFAARLRMDAMPSGAFELRGRLRREPGASLLDDVKGTIAGADVQLAGRIADRPRARTALDIVVAGPRLEAFAPLVSAYTLPTGAFRVAGGLVLEPTRVRLNRMQVSAAGAQGTLDADIELPLSAVRGDFRLAAKGDDITRFLPRLGAVRPFAASFDLRVRGQAEGGVWRLDEAALDSPAGSLTGSGRLDWAPDLSATSLKVSAKLPDLAAAGRLFALELPARPFELTAELTGTTSAFRVEQAKGRLGTTDFDGRLQLVPGEPPLLDVEFRSDLLDLTPYLNRPAPAAGAALPAPGPGRRRSDARLIPDAPIPLAWLRGFNGSLAVRASRALLATVALEELRVGARLMNGSLTLDTLEMAAPPDGRLRMSGSIDPRPVGAAVQLSASGTRVRLARPDDTSAAGEARPRADLELELAGTGTTWRELAQSLEGKFRLTAGAGNIPASSMDALFGRFWQDLVAGVVPGVTPRDSTRVRCLAAYTVIHDGVVQTAPALVMQTDNVNVIARGRVDLRTEHLEFYRSTVPRRGRAEVTMAEIVNPYMKATGTLASPGLGVDPKGVLFYGGAAAATAGISILAKGAWDRMFRADDPCTVVAAEATRLDSARPVTRRRLGSWPGRRQQ